MSPAGTLYAILDLAYVREEDAAPLLQELLAGGVDMIQLRGKNRSIDELSRLAEKLLPLVTAANVPFIVNDHADIARRVEVQGVHVGQDDEAIASVRARVERPIIVGKSTHNIAQAIAAHGESADYIGFGPLFATPTKPEYAPVGLDAIRALHQQLTIPIFCIGGIKLGNLGEVLKAGAQRVVIVSGLLQARDPRRYARNVKAAISNQHSAFSNS